MNSFFRTKPLFTFFFLFLFISRFTSAQWAQTGGPQGINVNVFYQKGSMLFCGTSSQGVFRSTDHGATWTAANASIGDRTVFALFADTSFLYATLLEKP